MPGGKRGLVAPQNTFLENIVRRSSGKESCSSEHSLPSSRPRRPRPAHPIPLLRGEGV
jgi:hypothetical protein